MFGRTIRIARIAGIPIGISPWWLAIVALFTWMLGSSYFPEAVQGISPALAYALGFASVLLLFTSLLLHELGHAIVARRYGVEVDEIDLWLLGGVARMHGEATEPGEELRYSLAGPAVTAFVTACFALLEALLPSSTPASVQALVEYQVWINAVILVFNLLPAFPLDGGRALRALLWRRSGDMQRSTALAAGVGRVFGYAMVGGGLLISLGSGGPNGLWLVLVGFFIATAAGQQAKGAEIRAVFAGEHPSDLMASEVVVIPADFPVSRAVAEYFGHFPYTAFPVIDSNGRAVGLLTIDDVRRVAHVMARSEPSVAEVAERDPELLVSADAELTALLERPAFARVGRAVVVDADSRPVGIVSISDVQRAIRSAQLRAGEQSKQAVG